MIKVSRRGGFSDRQGIKPENVEIQLYELDTRTRVQLYNMTYKVCNQSWSYSCLEENQKFYKYINSEVFEERIDAEETIDINHFYNKIHRVIMENSYDDVLTVVEAIAQYWNSWLANPQNTCYCELSCLYMNVFQRFNKVLKQEYVGYRFIDGQLSPITEQTEVDAIEEAVNNRYEIVSRHISKAHSLLADREHPDYENSIKESISSVEAMCQVITGTKGSEATLGRMLKKIEDSGVEIHAGLKAAFNILYGYTSDANGIRHAGDIGGPASTFEEAKFMLVSCCAFINYLKGVMAD